MKNLVIIDDREHASNEVANEFGLVYGANLAVNGQLIIEQQVNILENFFSELKIILFSNETHAHSLIQKKIFEKFKIEVLRSNLKFGDFSDLTLEIDHSIQRIIILNSNNLISQFPKKSSYIYVKTYEYTINRNKFRVYKNTNYKSNGSIFLRLELNKNIHDNLPSYLAKIQENPFMIKSFYSSSNLALDTISMFYELQRKIVNSRYFNSIKILTKTIVKSSNENQKIKNESSWFVNTHKTLALYTPRLISPEKTINNISRYEIERIAGFTLSDHFVFNNLDEQTWENIFLDAEKYLKKCSKIKLSKTFSTHNVNKSLFFDKLIERLKDFTNQSNIIWNKDFKINGVYFKSLKSFLKDIEEFLSDLPEKKTYMHGDFCFGNIIYESRLKRIFVIDPRGSFDSMNATSTGTYIYDRCKFYHSIYGLYDFIVHGMFDIKVYSPFEINMEIFQNSNVARIQEIYEKINQEDALNNKIAHKLLSTLFMSMLPLHAENKKRQFALFANAILIHGRNFS